MIRQDLRLALGLWVWTPVLHVAHDGSVGGSAGDLEETDIIEKGKMTCG